jgi:hypothetical protein
METHVRYTEVVERTEEGGYIFTISIVLDLADPRERLGEAPEISSTPYAGRL